MSVNNIEAILGQVAFDEEGFLINPNDWSRELASAIASREGLELTDRHWAVIEFNRASFAEDGEAPTLRRITKSTDVNTKELYALFPGGPAKLAAKVSGLGKPTGCI
ncbi:MAG: TusE/DsrC/DsvC family sulfur relay protein [Anaerolineales bacterium]|nr:TusE/DsrC/DsvC family sulfur relay protein [Anaerolineales bacterium]